MPLFGKKKQRQDSPASSPENEKTYADEPHDKSDLKRATRTRFLTALFTSFCLIITVIFLIIVEAGNTKTGGGLENIYFIRLDLSNVIPTSVPNASIINSIAQTLGLHDFYQVGLWNYCEGYNSQGVTSCTATQTLYWFNPVEIISNQLIAGASITLPGDLGDILDIIHVASNVMFGLFLTGACLSFVLIFLMPLSVRSRWIAFAFTILTFLNALFITAASIIATVMFIIMRNVFSNNDSVNIEASIGKTMFGLMWVASAFAIFAWLFQFLLCCCCVSRRDIKTGRKGYDGKKIHHNKEHA